MVVNYNKLFFSNRGGLEMGTSLSITREKIKELLAQGHEVYYPLPIKPFLKRFIVDAGLASSFTEAKRLLKARAIEIDSRKVPPGDKFILVKMN